MSENTLGRRLRRGALGVLDAIPGTANQLTNAVLLGPADGAVRLVTGGRRGVPQLQEHGVVSELVSRDELVRDNARRAQLGAEVATAAAGVGLSLGAARAATTAASRFTVMSRGQALDAIRRTPIPGHVSQGHAQLLDATRNALARSLASVNDAGVQITARQWAALSRPHQRQAMDVVRELRRGDHSTAVRLKLSAIADFVSELNGRRVFVQTTQR